MPIPGNVRDLSAQRFGRLTVTAYAGSSEHHAWSRHGGRGITVRPEWRSFTAFWTDMGGLYQPGLTIERIDPNGHSEPDSCRWATHEEQARNRRNNRLIGTGWGLITIAEAAERSGSDDSTIQYCVDNGQPTGLWARPFRPVPTPPALPSYLSTPPSPPPTLPSVRTRTRPACPTPTSPPVQPVAH